MSAYEKLKFSENLSSRLCHDLITPMGAINTGLELLLEQDDLKSQESEEIMELIRQSAQTSSNRLGLAHSKLKSDILLKFRKKITGEKYVAEKVSPPEVRGSFKALFIIARGFGSASYC